MKRELGQVYTEKTEIEKMISLIENRDRGTRVLEPSVGECRIYEVLRGMYDKVDGIEIDVGVIPIIYMGEIKNIDFFEYESSSGYDLIVCNPPYVKYNKIIESTRDKLDHVFFNELSNLYLHFIKKCIDLLVEGGEMVFINPVEFIKLTSGKELNEYIYDKGTITDFIDYGDKKVFKGASPNVCIWKYKKGLKDRVCRYGVSGEKKEFRINKGGVIYFGSVGGEEGIELGDIFEIKVGGFSGADKIFTSLGGNKEFVYSETRVSGGLRRMYYNVESEELEKYKEELMGRGCRKFNESNWYEWGRNYPESERKRIYVNCKTRVEKPFFLSGCKNFDGSVLGLFLRDETMDEEVLCEKLNSMDWGGLGFKCGGRYIFGQRTLSSVLVERSLFYDKGK